MPHRFRRAARLRRILVPLAALTVAAATLTACAGVPATAPTPATSSPSMIRPAAPEGELPVALQDRLRAALDETMTEYGVPGAAVGVWVPGEGQWTTAAGLADIENAIPATTEMSWPLRSITKSYTITLLLQLVDEGRVDLDDTIDEYVDGVTDGGRITLRELAAMSSGNADYTNDAFLSAFIADPDTAFTLDELNSYVLGAPAQFAPGTKKVYTNANTNLIGAVIEKVTDRPFAEVLDERILAPLGQTGTKYLAPSGVWGEPHAVGYAPEDDGPAPQPQNFSMFGPAGAMVTTLDDARVWADVLGTGALLDPATQKERLVGAPLDSGPPYGIYALGIGETEGWWGHNGEGLGFTSAIFHDPDSGASVVVFMNESNLPDKAHPANETFRRFAEILDAGDAR
jgi:D-alanyl-D-alanine carboxypeptidase